MKKNIKIAIDISPTKNGNSSRGVGFYTGRLVAAMQKVVKSKEGYKDFEITITDNPSNKLSTYDLVHYPFFDPFRNTLPKKTIPTVVTVHDLIPLDYPKNYPPGLRGRLTWLKQKNKLKQSDLIITDSISSKFSIQKHTGHPMDWIFSIPLGADLDFRPLKTKPKMDLPKKFVLYVGDASWNKNLPSLAKACIQLKVPLIIVGKTAAQNIENIPKHPETISLLTLKELEKKHPKLIKTVGWLADNSVLNKYYNLATCYCQPSYAEGFGLPLLEAMQAGCPVVWADATSLPEIAKYTGLSFDPDIPTDLSKQLEKMLSSSQMQQKSKQDGIKRAKLFSWEFTAIQTLEAYKVVLLKYGKN